MPTFIKSLELYTFLVTLDHLDTFGFVLIVEAQTFLFEFLGSHAAKTTFFRSDFTRL